MQLNSVARFHRIADRHPDEATALASAPETGVFGAAAVIFAILGLSTMAYQSQELFSNLLFTLGYFSALFGLSLGVLALLFGALGAIYRSWLIHRSLNPDYSFYEFILHSGNYYHRNPFLWK